MPKVVTVEEKILEMFDEVGKKVDSALSGLSTAEMIKMNGLLQRMENDYHEAEIQWRNRPASKLADIEPSLAPIPEIEAAKKPRWYNRLKSLSEIDGKVDGLTFSILTERIQKRAKAELDS